MLCKFDLFSLINLFFAFCAELTIGFMNKLFFTSHSCPNQQLQNKVVDNVILLILRNTIN